MDSNILKLYPQFVQSTDRRQENKSVDFERRKEERRQSTRLSNPGLNKDISKIKSKFASFTAKEEKIEKTIIDHKDTFVALSPIVPVRRVSSVPDKLADKDYTALIGTIAVAGVLLPEDMRDMKDAGKQLFWGEMPKYNHKEFQTHFSFIRGSFLESTVNKMVNKYGYYLHEWDKSLLDTRFGEKIRNLLNVRKTNEIVTERIVPQIRKDKLTGKYLKQNKEVVARQLEGSNIGKLICRALQRTTVYGTLTLSAFCLPSIIKAFNKPQNIEDKLANAGKQTLKSAVSVVSTIAGIGLGGALLVSLGLGPAGSVIGMGLGCIIGAYTSNKINKNIETL